MKRLCSVLDPPTRRFVEDEVLAVSFPTQAAARGVRRILLETGRAGSALCLTEACDCVFARDSGGTFPDDRVRLTSIYSKGDGVVRWQAALVPDADCMELTGSHVGLVFNRKTYRVIADALAVPELPVRAAHPARPDLRADVPAVSLADAGAWRRRAGQPPA